MPRFSCETKACQSEWKNKIKIKSSCQSAFPREYGDHLKKIQDTSLWWPHIYLSSKWQVQIYCRRASVDHRKQILGLTEGTLLEGGLRRAIPDLLKSLKCRLKDIRSINRSSHPCSVLRLSFGMCWYSCLWGEADAGYHLLDLFLVLQDVGLDCADLVLLVFD